MYNPISILPVSASKKKLNILLHFHTRLAFQRNIIYAVYLYVSKVNL